MHEYELLEVLAAGFTLALVFGYLAKRLGLSPIVGYLVAGFIAGPHTPGFVADPDITNQLSEAGVILLMFGVGLHFSIKDLLAVKGVAIPGALVQSLAATLLGAWAAHQFGFTWQQGAILGLGLSVASTVVLLRVLSDNGVVDTVHGHVAIGWLVVEDLFTVLILVLLPSVAIIMAEPETTTGMGPIVKALGLALLRLGLLFVLVMVVGGKVVPWILTHIVRTRSQELFTLAVLVSAFATAVVAALVFEASMALGAFLGGMVVGRTKVSHQAGADILPLRDAFAVLFFISVGMLFNPAFILEQPWLILICLAIVLVAKPLTAMLVVCVLGYSPRTALTVAISLAQIGEFSFILAQAAITLKLAPQDIYNILVVCAIISITINPGFFRQLPRIRAFLERRPGLWKIMNFMTEWRSSRGRQVMDEPKAAEHLASAVTTAIVVGYGPTGQSVVQALLDQRITPVLIDLNVDTVNEINKDNKFPAVFGDSSKKEILRAARLEKAAYLIITIPDMEATAATAVTARDLNPDIRILVRARFLHEARLLGQIGVTGVAYEEESVAKDLAGLLKEDIAACRTGAAACQIDFDQLEKENLSEPT